MEKFKCDNCGTLVDEDAIMCPKCGERFDEDEPESNPSKANKQDEVINYYILSAKKTKIVFIITAAIMIFIGLIMVIAGMDEEAILVAGIALIVAAIPLIYKGIFIEKELLWKAYVLKNLKDIKK